MLTQLDNVIVCVIEYWILGCYICAHVIRERGPEELVLVILSDWESIKIL